MPLSSVLGNAIGSGLGGAVGAGVGSQVAGSMGAAAFATAFAAAGSVASSAIVEAVAREYAEGGESATTSSGTGRRIRRPRDDINPPMARPDPGERTTAEVEMEQAISGLSGPYDPTDLWALASDCGVDVDAAEAYRRDLLAQGHSAAWVAREMRALLRHACEHAQLNQITGCVGSVFGLTDGDLVTLDAMVDAPSMVEPMKGTTRPEPRAGIGRLEGEDVFTAWALLAEAWGLTLDAATRLPASTAANTARVTEIAAARGLTGGQLFWIAAAAAEQSRDLDDWRAFLREMEVPTAETNVVYLAAEFDPNAGRPVYVTRSTVEPVGRRGTSAESTDTAMSKASTPSAGTGALWALAAVGGVGVLGTGIYFATRKKKRRR